MQNKELLTKKMHSLINTCAILLKINFYVNIVTKEGKVITQNQYAKLCGITSSTISKLKLDEGYNIPMSTIYNILRHERYTLEKFFKEFETAKGINIPD
jgi:DNA-binding Xre family transcriptional regulator